MKDDSENPEETRNTEQTISLLWPPDLPSADRQSGHWLNEHCIRDLDIAKLMAILDSGRRQADIVETILLRVCTDPRIIRYRQDILEDFLTVSGVCAGFETLAPIFAELVYGHYREDTRKPVFHEVVWRLNELARFVECLTGIQMVLSTYEHDLQSQGLQTLSTYVSEIREEPTFQELEKELPELLAQTEQVKSITIGVNLNHNLLPVEAALLSVNSTPVTDASLLGKLFGRSAETQHGIAPLHVAPQDTGTGIQVSPLLTPLFRDLAEVLDKVCQPLAYALKRYVRIQSRVLAGIGQEVKFYTHAAGFIARLRKTGLPMCKPEIAPLEERVCEIEGNYNVNLALHLMSEHPDQLLADRIVANRVNFNDQGRILLLTGPNKGGKTTYMQAIGLTHILAQAGLYVPGTYARISPVDTLHTHFPEEEQFDAGTGRFGDEAQRMQAIFTQITRHSLVLLNESFSSTSPAEALGLSRDIVRLLCELGARAVFATHLHELAAEIDVLNADISGESRILSMVASLIKNNTATPGEVVSRSYRVIPSPPMQSSRARELARQYGVSFEQLHKLLHERGVMRNA